MARALNDLAPMRLIGLTLPLVLLALAASPTQAQRYRAGPYPGVGHRTPVGKSAVGVMPDHPKAIARKLDRRVRAKNRGSLAKLGSIRRGTHFTLRNPTTGGLDTKARVVETGTNEWTQVPWARVRFSNGHVARYAAERLQLTGRPFREQLQYLRAHRERIRSAIEKELGLSTRDVRLMSLRGRHRSPRKGAKKAAANPGPFLRAFGEIEPSSGLLGFEIDKVARVSRHYAYFDIATPTHEIIHGMSEEFAGQMMDKNLTNAMEGITDYLTYQVVRKQFGVRQMPIDAYIDFRFFGEQVAQLIGRDTLAKIVFSSGKNIPGRLARAVDQSIGKKGAFMRAARKLEKGEEVSLGRAKTAVDAPSADRL